MKVRCFLLFVSFVFLFCFFSFLLLVIVTFLSFVVSSSPIRITLCTYQSKPRGGGGGVRARGGDLTNFKIF